MLKCLDVLDVFKKYTYSGNSLAPWTYVNIFKSNQIFNHSIQAGSLGVHWEISHRRMPQNFTYEKSTLVRVMAWCRQATSLYLIQWWLMSPYGFIGPQETNSKNIHRDLDLWVHNAMSSKKTLNHFHTCHFWHFADICNIKFTHLIIASMRLR